MQLARHSGDARSASRTAMADADRSAGYPHVVKTENVGVEQMRQTIPGVYEIRAKNATLPPLVLSGGMHGDEKSGIVIIDNLVDAIVSGKLVVKRHLLLMFGNLRAMAVNNFKGARCIEMEVGATSNLNRCFGSGMFASPRCYAERRANELMQEVERFVGSYGRPEAIDIHQSFNVPTLRDVREGADRTEYTYAMLYPIESDLAATLGWIRSCYSDIVAGAVINDMTVNHVTFAGYMAKKHGAHAATFEQGTIGFEDYNTFTPQLLANLSRKIAGEAVLEEEEGFDVWRGVRNVTKSTNNFRFIDPSGATTAQAPRDFLPQPAGTFARDGHQVHELAVGQRLLFANADVPIGDRVAMVIERLETTLVPRP
jgi:succinylglutamate desuccinylase